MKTSQNIATPAVQLIDGQPFVRVIDLAHLWNTTTASILATDKPHQVPEEHIRRIDGRVWCSFPGLRYRVQATKQGSQLTSLIREFLESHIEKKPTPEPTPTPTDLGTAALIADARRTASQALAKAEEAAKTAEDGYDIASAQRARANLHDENIKTNTNNISVALERIAALKESDENTQKFIKDADTNAYDYVHRFEALEKHMDTADLVAKSAANIAEEASEAVDRVKTTAQHAADLAQKNADRITVTGERISLRLDRLSEHVDRVEKDAIASREDALQRTRQAERQQRDNTARIQTLAEYAHGLDWTLAAVAVLGVAARMIRLLRRR